MAKSQGQILFETFAELDIETQYIAYGDLNESQKEWWGKVALEYEQRMEDVLIQAYNDE